MSTLSNPEWLAASRALRVHWERLERVHLRELFASDLHRPERFTLEACGLVIDCSRQRLDEPALAALLELARAAGLEQERERLFAGEPVNATEGRAALHMALRCLEEGAFPSPERDVMPQVREVRARMARFSRSVREGEWRGHTGERITDVVNIGIGGSDLGPRMVCDALGQAPEHWEQPLRTHFVANLDPTDLAVALRGLDPRRTLFIVASKTFGTQETLTNARSARRWVVDSLGGEAAVGAHFVAVSTNEARVREFGIDPANMFGFWDWVGGRYSLWSAIGLPIALGFGYEVFERLLAGAWSMDRHFRSAPPAQSLPTVLALLRLWNTELLGAETRAVLSYDHGLRRLPDHLQQLEMESLGKRVTVDGRPVPYPTGPIVWGGLGNNGQHAFYQLLHQGTFRVPCDFLVPARTLHPDPGHERAVLANALAQAATLMQGRTEGEARRALEEAGCDPERAAALAPHLVMPGNQPSTLVLYERLTPETLGALVALHEHAVFAHAVCLGINPFDQWGVERGKELARAIEPLLAAPSLEEAGQSPGFEPDPATLALVRRLRAMRGQE